MQRLTLRRESTSERLFWDAGGTDVGEVSKVASQCTQLPFQHVKRELMSCMSQKCFQHAALVFEVWDFVFNPGLG